MKSRLFAVLTAVTIVLAAVVGPTTADSVTRQGFTRVTNISEKVVALTFDDGPDPRYTPQMLDLLAAHNAKATFFVVGDEVVKHPDLAQRIVAEGHELANHTTSHPFFNALTEEQAKAEIANAQQAIEGVTGVTPKYFRAPRGQVSSPTYNAIKSSGLKHASWTVCLERSAIRSPEARAKRVMSKIFPGAIILTHDGLLDRSGSVEATRDLLNLLDAEGYRVVTLAQLEQLGGLISQALSSAPKGH